MVWFLATFLFFQVGHAQTPPPPSAEFDMPTMDEAAAPAGAKAQIPPAANVPPKTATPPPLPAVPNSTSPRAQLPPPSSPPNIQPPPQTFGEESDSFGQNGVQFIYDPTSGRDPFKMPKGVRADSRDLRRLAPIEQKDPLQRINLEKLQILGILWDTNHPKAMIRDGETSAVFTISKNTKVGPNQGIVTDIREGSILVLETFTNDDGDEIKIPKVISIRK